jgi:hypothetical protein
MCFFACEKGFFSLRKGGFGDSVTIIGLLPGDIFAIFSLIFVKYYECADFSKNM